jgi:hypothetical protein
MAAVDHQILPPIPARSENIARSISVSKAEARLSAGVARSRIDGASYEIAG